MREFKGKLVIIFAFWSILTVSFHVYTAFFGTLEPRLQRAIHLLLLFPIVFILFPSRHDKKDSNPTFVDWILAIISLAPSLYLILNAGELRTRIELVDRLTLTQIVLGTIMILLVLEACRRAVSLSFSVIVTLAFLYIFIAPYLPGVFNARQYSFERVIEILFLTTDQGVYGFLTGISANILFIFILFAAIMLRSGIGQFFMDLSILIAGKYRGGPAKVSVLSSGLYGSISGSSVADIYATGSFGIPLMKKIGYPAAKAGAIEAVSSAGGPLIPPVMGAGAFIMAEMTGTPFTEVIKASVLCAIIYYIGILAMVHFEAVSLDLKSVSEEFKVGAKNVFKRIPYLIPFVVLIYFMFSGLSPTKSAVYSLLAMLLIWLIVPWNRLTVKELVGGMSYAVKMGSVIVSALAGASIIVSIITQTGLALTLSTIVIKYSFGQQWIALILIMIVTILLGAGIPTTPAYVITATVASGALTFFDVPILTAHLFVFYFAILADITPPVGVTAFAAANIAQSPPMKTALLTPKFAFAGFIVPYVFVYQPALLMHPDASLGVIILSFISTVLGVVSLAAAIIGYMFNKLSIIKRLILLALVLTAITNQILLSLISIVGIILIFAWEYWLYKRSVKTQIA